MLLKGYDIYMKKGTFYFFAFFIICFILPALLTKRANQTSTIPSDQQTNTLYAQEEKKQDKYKYNKYAKIKLLHKKTKKIEEVALDEYLYHVVSSEMPADFEIEALKAQAIVARTYTIYKVTINNNKHKGADICDDSTCCQAWISKEDRLKRWEKSKQESNWNKIVKAVDETGGDIITYNNKPINAFFHSNSGGRTEIPVNVWGGEKLPYLQTVETSGEEWYKQYSSSVTLTEKEIIEKLKQKYKDIKIDFKKEDSIKILEYTEGDRVKTIQLGNKKISGVEARTIFGLKSSNFTIKKQKNNKYTFEVKGYGHGVGMSQTGADSLAKQGKNAKEIIEHFYTNVEIKKINSL